MAGQLTSLSYTKFMDPDGDFVITETITSGAAGETEGNFKFLQGTGKWKGIKGGGEAHREDFDNRHGDAGRREKGGQARGP